MNLTKILGKFTKVIDELDRYADKQSVKKENIETDILDLQNEHVVVDADLVRAQNVSQKLKDLLEV